MSTRNSWLPPLVAGHSTLQPFISFVCHLWYLIYLYRISHILYTQWYLTVGIEHVTLIPDHSYELLFKHIYQYQSTLSATVALIWWVTDVNFIRCSNPVSSSLSLCISEKWVCWGTAASNRPCLCHHRNWVSFAVAMAEKRVRSTATGKCVTMCVRVWVSDICVQIRRILEIEEK